MERERPPSPELQELEALVIEGLATAIRTGRIDKEYGESLIQTYKNAVRRNPNEISPQDTEEVPEG